MTECGESFKKIGESVEKHGESMEKLGWILGASIVLSTILMLQLGRGTRLHADGPATMEPGMNLKVASGV